MGRCNTEECLRCTAREFCITFGDEGYFSCDKIKEMYEKDKENNVI